MKKLPKLGIAFLIVAIILLGGHIGKTAGNGGNDGTPWLLLGGMVFLIAGNVLWMRQILAERRNK